MKKTPDLNAWRDQASDYERGFIDGMQKQAQSSVDRAVNRLADRTGDARTGVYSDIVSDGGMDPRNQPEPQRWAVFCGGCKKQWSVPYQHPGKSICADCESKLNEPPSIHQRFEAAMDEVAHRFAHRLALDLECVLARYQGPWYDEAWDTLGQYRNEMNKLHEQVSPTFMGEPVAQKWFCLSCKSSTPGHHGTLDDRTTPCPEGLRAKNKENK